MSKKMSLDEYVLRLCAANGNVQAKKLLKELETCYGYKRTKDIYPSQKNNYQELIAKYDEVMNSDNQPRIDKYIEALNDCYMVERDPCKIVLPAAYEEKMAEIEKIKAEQEPLMETVRGKLKVKKNHEEIYAVLEKKIEELRKEALEFCEPVIDKSYVPYSNLKKYNQIMQEVKAFSKELLKTTPICLDDAEYIEKLEKEHGLNYYNVDCLSATGIKKIIKSPRAYQYFMEEENKKTKDLVVGQLLHCMILEPNKVVERFKRAEFPGTTTEGKAERAEAKAKGIELVNASDFDECVAMAEAVLNHQTAGVLFTDDIQRHCEVEYYFNLDVNGTLIPCKAKADQRFLFPDGSACILDVKTCRDAFLHPEDLQKVILNYGYHIQAAWYLDHDKFCNPENPAKDFYFVFVSKEQPHLVTVFRLDEAWLELGRKEYQKGMEIYAECLKTGEYPTGCEDNLFTLPVPAYAYTQREIKVEDENEQQTMAY